MAARDKNIACVEAGDMNQALVRHENAGCRIRWELNNGCRMMNCPNGSVYVCPQAR